ncbi:hypothetical protein [Bacillus paranthracis]|uniref:hypothetical protein n=1 Tax=Bacillus paranthracis TaxID=2026186 RepID=UPI0022E6A7B1|nr:hypothetical protein [Bacillus paranthracis]
MDISDNNYSFIQYLVERKAYFLRMLKIQPYGEDGCIQYLKIKTQYTEFDAFTRMLPRNLIKEYNEYVKEYYESDEADNLILY